MAVRSGTPAIVAMVVVAAVTFGGAVWITRPGTVPPGSASGVPPHVHALPATYNVTDPAQVLALPVETAPTLTVAIRQAVAGSWDLELGTTRFRYVTDDRTELVPGEGHAHLFVDGNYITQFNTGHVHLEPLPPGVHTLDVGLFAVDHRAYAAGGKLVMQRVVVVAPEPGSALEAPRPNRKFAVAFAGGRITGTDTLRVSRNDALELRWSSDVPASFHLEGYEAEFSVSPEMPVTVFLHATQVGRFAIQGNAGVVRGTGPVMYLEVFP